MKYYPKSKLVQLRRFFQADDHNALLSAGPPKVDESAFTPLYQKISAGLCWHSSVTREPARLVPEYCESA